jgi:hypothetical protein
MEGRDHLRDLNINVSIIKMDLQETGFVWLRIACNAGFM